MLSGCARFAVLDTETTFQDRVMPIGVVIADAQSMQIVEKRYILISPDYLLPAMYSHVIRHKRARIDKVAGREAAIREVRALLERHGTNAVFAYNARFDQMHLPELKDLEWYDIIRLAAYRQFNRCIDGSCDCCKTGRLRTSYSAETIYRMISGDNGYCEVHNAVTDAEDELAIMRMLGQPLEAYEIARIKPEERKQQYGR